MNLLLLLSALLSAMTGSNVSSRAPQVTTEQAAAVAQRVVVTVPSDVARPIASLPALRAFAKAPHAAVFMHLAAEPIFASRLRE